MTMSDDDILQYFANNHLPEDLRRISEAIRGVAFYMAGTLPPNPERREGLRRLLEAKDCFVRAQLTGAAAHVLISKDTFDRLEAAANWLQCLEAAGVNSWEGCEEAAKLCQKLEEAKQRE